MKFQDLVKGCHGRKIAYTDVEQITEDNIVKVIGDCIGVFYYNKPVIKYLWEYYKGDQPVLYRTNATRMPRSKDCYCDFLVKWEIKFSLILQDLEKI